jgi:hypothetical protein
VSGREYGVYPEAEYDPISGVYSMLDAHVQNVVPTKSEEVVHMALLIAFIVLLVLFILTFFKLPEETVLGSTEDDKAKVREYLILDIRGANQYCIAYISLLGVMAVIGLNNRDFFKTLLDKIAVWPFEVAFVAAALSTVFIPVGYGGGVFKLLRIVWFKTVVCEQVLVVSVCYGIRQLFVVLAS